MALIKCPECHKNISDECKKCPQCGYKLKKNKFSDIFKSIADVFKKNETYTFFKDKITLSCLQILSLITLICSFIVSISDRCFSRSVYPTGFGIPSQITLDNFHWALEENGNYIFIWYIMIITFVLGIISIIAYNSKFNKLKKKVLLYLPNVIYPILVLITIILSFDGDLGDSYPKGHSQYSANWGAYYVFILSIISIILLFINNRKQKK